MIGPCCIGRTMGGDGYCSCPPRMPTLNFLRAAAPVVTNPIDREELAGRLEALENGEVAERPWIAVELAQQAATLLRQEPVGVMVEERLLRAISDASQSGQISASLQSALADVNAYVAGLNARAILERIGG